jgi:hypothetical protein
MAQLSERQRDKLPDSAFAYIDRDGDRHLPINDEEHIRNAMARFDQTDFESAAAKERARKRIVAAARKHDIEVDESDHVARAAR